MITSARPVKFIGPLNYRHIRLVSLIAMTVSQIAALLLLIGPLYRYINEPDPFAKYHAVLTILKLSGHITMPLLLISALSVVLRGKTPAVWVLIWNFVLAAAICVFNFFAFRIITVSATAALFKSLPMLLRKAIDIISRPGFGKILATIPDSPLRLILEQLLGFIRMIPGETMENIINSDFIRNLITKATSDEVVLAAIVQVQNMLPQYAWLFNVKNIFLDIFLCVSSYYLIMVKPSRLRGGKLMIMRLCALIPVCYAIAGFFIHGAIRLKWFAPNMLVLAMLPSNALGNYMIFAAMIFFRKYQELEHVSRAGNDRDLREYLTSNRAARQMAIFLAGAMCMISLLDFLLAQIPNATAWGFGNSCYMFLGVPFVVLFSCVKQPKHRWIDVLYVPVYYVISYVLVFVAADRALTTLIKSFFSFIA